MKKRADIDGVIVKYDIPAFFNIDEDNGDSHDKMLNELLDLPRSKETICGHWAHVRFEYLSLKQAMRYSPIDALRIQKIVNKATPK